MQTETSETRWDDHGLIDILCTRKATLSRCSYWHDDGVVRARNRYLAGWYHGRQTSYDTGGRFDYGGCYDRNAELWTTDDERVALTKPCATESDVPPRVQEKGVR